jgi:hypothetical protein
MTLKIGYQVNVTCPNCYPKTKLIVYRNSITGRLFLGCPNHGREDDPNSCDYTRGIPTDLWMRATNQETLFPLNEEVP